MTENRDARVRYTRTMIKKAFFDLLRQKPINKITVTEICELAHINRSTFYKHYHDVYDIMEQFQADAADALVQFIMKNKDQDPHVALLTVVTEFSRHYDLFSAIISSAAGGTFMQDLSQACFDSFHEEAVAKGQTNSYFYSSLNFSYYTGGISGVLSYWVKNGMQETPEEIANAISRLFHGKPA